MANIIDSKMPQDKQDLVKKIINELNLDNLKVKYLEKNGEFEFIQDRRVVTVPLKMALGEVDEGVRFLFRSILAHENNKWNRAADWNDWGGRNHYK